MVKSRAEIQKAYRQRLKEKDNAQYLARERRRRKANYVPSSQLSRAERANRNQKNRDYLRSYRQKKKLLAQAEIIDNVAGENEEVCNTSGYESASSVAVEPQAGPSHLVVQMRFPARARGPRVRMQNTLNACRREMKVWKEKYEILHKKYRSKLRAIQRSRKTSLSQLTPRSKTDKQVKNLGLRKDQIKSVRKQLLFSNVLCEEVKSAKKKTKKHHRGILHGLVGGEILKKYRCIRMASTETGLCRNKLGRSLSKSVSIERFKRRREIFKHREKVVSFMERDDNSRMMPGKKDYKTENHEKKQTRVLTDYLSNLHQKFMSENKGIKLSLSSFCRIRPKSILLASFISRSTCLCTRHQNMSLTLKSARNENVRVCLNADKMLDTKENFLEDLKQTVTSDEIILSQWKRVAVEEKGKKKMVMRVVEQKVTKQEFVTHTEAQVEDLRPM